MKKISLYAAALAVMAVSSTALTSCDDDFARPPVVAPESQWAGQENTTIAELKELYWQNSTNYATEIGTMPDGSHRIVKARVISTDINSTIYNNMYIQDATGAMTVAARQASSSKKLATQYGYAQEVYLDVTGLSIGRYSGLFQLGQASSNGISFLENSTLTEHVEANGLGDPSAIERVTLTVAELTDALKAQDAVEELMCRAVTIPDVHFMSPGTKFIPTSGADANITFADESGKTMIIRLNRYCTFGSKAIPAGTGSINGILSYYGSNWQIVINSEDDLVGFESTGDEGESTESVTLMEETFASSAGKFTFDHPTLTGGLEYVWSYDANYHCAKASSFKNNVNLKCEGWLISPEVDLAGCKSAALSFDQAFSKHFGSTDAEAKTWALKECTVWARTGNGAWEQITGYDLPAQPWSFNFGGSGDVKLDKYVGKKVQIGFKYAVAADGDPSGTWEVKNVKITAVK